MVNVFYVGDSGINIEVDLIKPDGTVYDISTSSIKKIIFIKPDNTRLPVDATFVNNGVDGKMSYTIDEGLLDQAGRWKVYAYVSWGSFDRTSSTSWFEVKKIS